MTRRGWLLFAAMAVIWGIPYLLIKIAVGELTPVTLVFLRTAVGATLLLPIAAARGGLRPLLPYWRWVLAYTVVEVSLPWFLLSDAERRLSSSLTVLLIAAVALIGEVGPVRATVITYFNPAVALLLGVTLLNEPFTAGAVVGFSLILTGSLLATRRASGPAAGEASSASSSSASGGPDTPGLLRRSRG